MSRWSECYLHALLHFTSLGKQQFWPPCMLHTSPGGHAYCAGLPQHCEPGSVQAMPPQVSASSGQHPVLIHLEPTVQHWRNCGHCIERSAGNSFRGQSSKHTHWVPAWQHVAPPGQRTGSAHVRVCLLLSAELRSSDAPGQNDMIEELSKSWA